VVPQIFIRSISINKLVISLCSSIIIVSINGCHSGTNHVNKTKSTVAKYEYNHKLGFFKNVNSKFCILNSTPERFEITNVSVDRNDEWTSNDVSPNILKNNYLMPYSGKCFDLNMQGFWSDLVQSIKYNFQISMLSSTPWRMSPSILTHSAIFMVLLPLPPNVRQHYPYVHH
jgi:hypothetical protein